VKDDYANNDRVVIILPREYEIYYFTPGGVLSTSN